MKMGDHTSALDAKAGMPESPKPKSLRLPVVSASSEYLVMGYLMRRNILA